MIDRIHIDNFLGFSHLNYDSVSPLTVVIGKNDTGKTGLLKLIYAVARTLVEIERSDKSPNLKGRLGDKLTSTFFPRKGGIGALVTKGADGPLDVNISFSGTSKLDVHFGFSKDATKELGHGSDTIRKFAEAFNVIFIPAKEILTSFRAIALSRENFDYEEFDDTYYDLIKALRIKTSQGRVADGLKKVNEELEQMFEGKIVQTTDDQANPFMFKKGNTQFTMPLTAEGIKKIGVLTTLIGNREISTNTILFFDEPETALHPEAQRKFAEMLYALTKIKGIQIFLATHSYFMINQFTNIARRDNAKINCISIEKEVGAKYGTQSIHDLREGLPLNSIIQEAQAMFMEDMKIELGL